MNAATADGRLRAMSNHGYAIDLYIGECARRGLARATQTKYTEVLYELADFLEARRVEPHQLTLDHARRFLDQYLKPRPPRRGQHAPRPPVTEATMALYVTVIRGYIDFLEDEGVLEHSFAAKLKRPKRKRPEDVAVVTTSGSDVGRLFDACDPDRWDDVLCIGTLVYLGVRREAAAQLRRHDVDLEAGFARFREKGGKIITKPIPDPLLELYRAAEQEGVWIGPRDFVIPNRKPTRTPGVRSNKVVYAIVKRVAARARVSAHPHALRAAFAVQFDEQFPREQHTLQILLGHARPETTHVYLRRKNKAKAMETVRGLSFGLRPDRLMPPTGFEPVLPASVVPEPLRRKLDELRARSRRRARN